MRTLVRETVFKFIFSKLFNQDDEGLFDVLIKDFSASDKSFANELISAVNSNYDGYVQKLSDMAVGYKFERLYNVDKCLIILGMAELDNFPDTPSAVIINEIVNISAKYSTENGMNFINGILAQYAKDR